MKLLQQQSPQQQGSAVGGSGWSSAPSSGLSKAGKSLTMLEMQEAERILKQQQQRVQQQRVSTFFGMNVGRCWKQNTHRHILFNIRLAASRAVHGELLHGRTVGRRCGHVGRSGGKGRKRRLLQQHGDVGRGGEEPGRPAGEHQQQPGPEEQPQQPLSDVCHAKQSTRHQMKPTHPLHHRSFCFLSL